MPHWKPGDADRRKVLQFEVSEDSKRQILADAASIAAKVVSDAADVALKAVSAAANAAQSSVSVDIGYIKADIAEMKLLLESKYVTKEAFSPVKAITYGLVGLILVAVIGAIIASVVVRVPA